jgi:hypothetical protein
MDLLLFAVLFVCCLQSQFAIANELLINGANLSLSLYTIGGDTFQLPASLPSFFWVCCY